MVSPQTSGEITAFMGYVPVMSDGYERLWTSMSEPRNCYVLGDDILGGFDHLRKDIRALSPERAALYCEASGYFGKVTVLHAFEESSVPESRIVVPDDELADLITTSLPSSEVVRHPIFLRWDRKVSSISVDVNPDRTVDASELEGWVVPALTRERHGASNWWRWVSAAVKTKDGTILAAHNHHFPTDFSPSVDGDIRMNFGREADLDKTTDLHAEADIISRAAREGIPLEGAEVFVSTFTCPPCAKLVAVAGIQRCFYMEGYAMGDGLSVLQDAGVEVVRVMGVDFVDEPERLRPYKTKN